MKMQIKIVSVYFFVFFVFSSGPAFSKESVRNITESLRSRIEEAGLPVIMRIDEEPVFASEALPKFYEAGAYQPVWIENNRPNKKLFLLVKMLKNAGDEGLRPQDYHLSEILSILSHIEKSDESFDKIYRHLVDLELLCTDAFMIYGSHLVCGRINPETIDPEWHANRRGHDMSVILRKAVESGKIDESLQLLLPQYQEYKRLKTALIHYRVIRDQGGWTKILDGPKIQKGDSGERVLALIQRLISEYPHMEKTILSKSEFDDSVETAIKRFQHLHGLEPDGVVGKGTIAALNISPEEKIRSIEINLERWRWLPENLGARYVLVNMADFKLDVMEDDQSVLDMRIIVGRNYRRTPVFSDRITYLVLNPHWNVPPNIAVKDKLPVIQKNPAYLAGQGIRVFDGYGSESKEIDPNTIDWKHVTPKSFRYRLRQDPGPLNALGQVKFMFPNRHNVYLHDTPSRDLFAKTVRTFSSGCIRIEKPIDLALYLLKDDPNWQRENLLTSLNQGMEKTISLKSPVPVHLLYWTVVVDEKNEIRFRDDIYGRDKRLMDAFYQKAPESALN